MERQPPRARIDQPTDEEADGEEAAPEKWTRQVEPSQHFTCSWRIKLRLDTAAHGWWNVLVL
jgi:hypothetical protein